MPRPRKEKQSKLQRQKHEQHRRKLLHHDQPWLQRIEYICSFLFDNNVPAFARAIELDSTHLGKILNRRHAVSTELVAQILSHTDVCANWLLWGDGPMLRGDLPQPGAFVLPNEFHSSFPLFNPLTAVVPPRDTMSPYATELASNVSPEHITVARVIHSARVENRPVILFIGATAIHAGAGIVSAELLRKKYVTAVATTGTGLMADIRAAEPKVLNDLNYVARMAATQGIGYGEAAGRWAFDPKDNKTRSLIYAAYELGVPATIHVEVGEMAEHAYPSGIGAELGAAIGAATYIDLLVFAEQVRQLCQTDRGVMLFIGDAMRGLHLFLQTRAAVPCVGDRPGFHAVLFDNHVQPDFAPHVVSHNGTHHKLTGTYRANVTNLLEACDGVFSGKITQTIKSA